LIIWVIAGLLGFATGLRIGWALVNKQSVVSAAMILALSALGLVATLNWQPLTLLLDTVLRWPNISIALSQMALIACAAGSCVMITAVSSARKPTAVRYIAIAQYAVAAVIAAVSLVLFFRAGRQAESAPEEYLKRNLHGGGTSMAWLLALLYMLFALTLVSWAGLRHSNQSRRGRALFVFTVGIVLIVAVIAFFLLRAVAATPLVGIGAAATLLGCAMLMVAVGSLLTTIEDWFGARREMRMLKPLLNELLERQPHVGIGVRPRGPLVFRVAEQMSLISDALYLEATQAAGPEDEDADVETGEPPSIRPQEQALAIAEWINASSLEHPEAMFPGLSWLQQPANYSDRDWILSIAHEYRTLDRAVPAPTT
jgi:hypothetical protein